MKSAIRLSVWLLAVVALTGFAFLAGSYLGRTQSPLATASIRLVIDHLLCQSGDCGYRNATDRIEESCRNFQSANPRRMVLLTMGQSNAGNHGSALFTSQFGATNFDPFSGKCYRAKDPLLGATGAGGSPWTPLADLLIEQGHFDEVLIVPIAVAGTRIEAWLPDGYLHNRIVDTINRLTETGIEITHIAWHQGEANASIGTSAHSYLYSFNTLVGTLRNLGVSAPIYAATATICYNQGNASISEIQQRLPSLVEGVYRGANTDTLDQFNHRYDLCHFSEQGLRDHASLWAAALTAAAE